VAIDQRIVALGIKDDFVRERATEALL